MFTIFKQVQDNKSVYSYRNKSVGVNGHVIHVGNGTYINKVHPEIYPMQEVADGFSSKEDVLSAIEMYIKIDTMRGVDARRATPAKPALRINPQ